MLESFPNQMAGLVDARVGACGDLFNMVARDGDRRIPNGSLVEVGRLAPRLLQDRRSRVPLRLSWGFEVRDRGLRKWCDRAVGVDTHVLDTPGDDLGVTALVDAPISDVVFE